MGLFSSKKTYVSSTLYNLAGEVADRPNYMKSLVVGNVISNSSFSVSETLRSGYLNGPGMRLKSFFKWAEDNYTAVGVPGGSLGGRTELDYAVLQDEIPTGAGESVLVQFAEVGVSEYSYWAEQWMFLNYPELIDTGWVSDFNESTGEIDITFADLTQASFTPSGFVKGAVYIYANYMLAYGAGADPVVPGNEITITPATDPFPSTTGWTLVSNTTTAVEANTQQVWVYEKTVYMGQEPDPLTDYTYSIKSTMTFTELRDPANAILSRKHKTDTQKIIHNGWSVPRMFIYRIGSGNAVLDQMVYAEANDGEYVPFIPIRVDNKFISPTHQPVVYEQAKKAFRRTGGGNFDDMVEKIAENEDLGDIDYAYVMYGVPLNVLDNTSREYLYRYFDKLRLSQTTSNAEYAAWQASMSSYDNSVSTWNQWKDAQYVGETEPLFGAPPPTLEVRPAKPESYVHIRGPGSFNANVNIKLQWQSIQETTGTGLKKVGAKKGEVWLQVEPLPPGAPDKIRLPGGGVFNRVREDNSAFSINWQIDENNWKSLLVIGAVHENLIYNGKSVRITGKEALEDAEESGFLVPIHYATLDQMRLVDYTQMSTHCTFVVFNSYKVVKKKWYQTGIFKILVIVALIALTIAFPPLGSSALAGYASIGAMIGLTGVLGIVFGAIVTQLVTMIVMRIVGKLSAEVFGAKFGAIFAAVFMFAATTIGASMLGGATLSAAWGNLMSAPNLLQLTMATANGVSGYIQASAMEYVGKTESLMQEFDGKMKELSELFAQNIGYGTGSIDPLSLTDVSFGNPLETEQQFLDRTLLTGSDIAEMSMEMLTKFSELTLSTELPISG